MQCMSGPRHHSKRRVLSTSGSRADVFLLQIYYTEETASMQLQDIVGKCLVLQKPPAGTPPVSISAAERWPGQGSGLKGQQQELLVF